MRSCTWEEDIFVGDCSCDCGLLLWRRKQWIWSTFLIVHIILIHLVIRDVTKRRSSLVIFSLLYPHFHFPPLPLLELPVFLDLWNILKSRVRVSSPRKLRLEFWDETLGCIWWRRRRRRDILPFTCLSDSCMLEFFDWAKVSLFYMARVSESWMIALAL